jgi:hypothetical protein
MRNRRQIRLGILRANLRLSINPFLNHYIYLLFCKNYYIYIFIVSSDIKNNNYKFNVSNFCY